LVNSNWETVAAAAEGTALEFATGAKDGKAETTVRTRADSEPWAEWAAAVSGLVSGLK